MPERRILGDWLEAYLRVTANLEAKESLHRWTGLVCLSTALKRRVHISMEHGTIYPNLYVFMVAESAKARKSTAMDYGREIITEAFPTGRIYRDNMTPQGLVRDLNRNIKVEHGIVDINETGDFVVFADELANLFGSERVRASTMVILLTRIFGCPKVYDHLTVKDSLVRLYNLYPVILGGTDPSNLKTMPPESIGGLTGRILWVIEKDKRHVNSGWMRDERAILEREALRECLIHDLQRIGELEGEIRVKPDAQELYDEWYKMLSAKNEPDKQTDAFYHRCHTTALQVAQLLAISANSSMMLEVSHMTRAIAMIEEQLPLIRRVTVWAGTGQYEQHRAKFMLYMQSMGGIAAKSKVLKYMGITTTEFDEIIDTLTHDGTIDSPKVIGTEVVIKLSAKPQEKPSA